METFTRGTKVDIHLLSGALRDSIEGYERQTNYYLQNNLYYNKYYKIIYIDIYIYSLL